MGKAELLVAFGACECGVLLPIATAERMIATMGDTAHYLGMLLHSSNQSFFTPATYMLIHDLVCIGFCAHIHDLVTNRTSGHHVLRVNVHHTGMVAGLTVGEAVGVMTLVTGEGEEIY